MGRRRSPCRLIFCAGLGLAQTQVRRCSGSTRSDLAFSASKLHGSSVPLRSDRRPSTRGCPLRGDRRNRSCRPNFSLTFVFVTVWLGFPRPECGLRERLRRVLSVEGNRQGLWMACAATGAGNRKARQSTRRRSAGGRRRSDSSPSSGSDHLRSDGRGRGSLPEIVAKATVIYSVYTLVMMGVFGVEKWNSRGEFFSVYFGMFASMSSFQSRKESSSVDVGSREPPIGQTCRIAGARRFCHRCNHLRRCAGRCAENPDRVDAGTNR